MNTTIFIGLLGISTVTIAVLVWRLMVMSAATRRSRAEAETAAAKYVELERKHAELTQKMAAAYQRFKDVVDVDAEKRRVLGELEAERSKLQEQIARIRQGSEQATQKFMAMGQQAEREFQDLQARHQREMGDLQSAISKLRAENAILEEDNSLYEFAFYKPRYSFSSSGDYQKKLDKIRAEQKRSLTQKQAAVCNIKWTVNGSEKEGKKQIDQTLRMMLRAFNGECDAAIAKVRYNNIHVMEQRIRKSRDAINGMAQVQQCRIVDAYMDLKLQELDLVHGYQEKLQEEKEEQRRIREQMREEEIAQRELERAREEAEREADRYEESLRRARAEVATAVGAKQAKLQGQIDELERRLAEAQANRERAIARAQMTRSGHVYIISNIGSFGEHVFKIGMTRRLEPMDRIRELGDASVPFQFDVHAIIWSEDAPALEAALHRLFTSHRINRVNERKEFFRVSIERIAEAVRKHHGEIEFVLDAEAVEYRKTIAILDELGQSPMLMSQPSPMRGMAVHG